MGLRPATASASAVYVGFVLLFVPDRDFFVLYCDMTDNGAIYKSR